MVGIDCKIIDRLNLIAAAYKGTDKYLSLDKSV